MAFSRRGGKEIATTGGRFRGEVINEMIHLEHKIEVLLTRYFCADSKKSRFFLWSVLRARMLQFKDKAEILFSVLKEELVIEASTAKRPLDRNSPR